MKHAALLRQYIEKYNPDFKDNPNRLQINIESGGIKMRFGSLSYSNEYVAIINFNQWDLENSSIDRAFFPILLFLYEKYPEKIHNLENAQNLLEYNAQILDDFSCTLSIALKLDERINVTKGDDDSITFNYLSHNIINGENSYPELANINALLKDLIPHPFE